MFSAEWYEALFVEEAFGPIRIGTARTVVLDVLGPPTGASASNRAGFEYFWWAEGHLQLYLVEERVGHVGVYWQGRSSAPQVALDGGLVLGAGTLPDSFTTWLNARGVGATVAERRDDGTLLFALSPRLCVQFHREGLDWAQLG